jgi:hypothetical protein
LVKLKTSPGNAEGILLSDEEYGRQRLELLKEKDGFEEILRDAGQRVEQWVKLSEQTFEFACTARSQFTKGDAKTKKEILVAIGSNLTLKGKRLRIEAKKPFLILEKSLAGDEEENDPIEPDKMGLPQRRKEANASHRPRLLGGLDDVRTLDSSLGRQYQTLVKEIYRFFRKRSSCPCDRCQSNPFDFESNLARMKEPPRWNSLPLPARKCLIK